jgi:hypothetical protein
MVRILVPLVVIVLFALARKYLPASSAKEADKGYDLSALRPRFQGITWLVYSAMIFIGILSALGIHTILVRLNHYFSHCQQPSCFLLSPQTAIWWFFPGFFAMCLSWDITLKLWSLARNPRDVALYRHYTNLSCGFDSTRILRWMSVLIVLPIGVLTVLELSAHTCLSQDTIRDCGYAFTSCLDYRYADAVSMTTIDGLRGRDGSLVKRAGIIIDFNDGRRWSSADVGNFEPIVDPKLSDFLQDRVRLPMNHAITDADIPQPNPRGSRP